MSSHYYWCKLHYRILDDERFREVSERAAWTWILCLLYAGERREDGRLQTTSVVAWRLRVSEDELLQDLEALRDAGLLNQDEAGKWSVAGFQESQRPASGAERVRQHRKSNRDAKCYPTGNGRQAKDGHVTKDVTTRYTDKYKYKDEDDKRGRQKTSPENRMRYLDDLDD